MEDRRISPRVPLDAPFYVSIRFENGRQCSAILIDCGNGGAQLALAPMEHMVQSPLGQTLCIDRLPEELSAADPEGCAAVVTWVSLDRCGVRFLQPLALTDEELLAVASKL